MFLICAVVRMMLETTVPKEERIFVMTGQEKTRTWFSRDVEANLDALYGAAMRLTRCQADAEDLVAESITRAWASVDSLEDRARFRPWLYRIMNNCFISHWRKKSVRPLEVAFDPCNDEDGRHEVSALMMEQPDSFQKWWASPEKEFFNSLLGDQIRQAMEELPEVFRVTIQLINVDGLGYDEAAAVLGIPTGTVRSRMKRGRTLLQKALWQQARDEGLQQAGKGTLP